MINLGLITQSSPYTLQNPDGFFIFGVIFCFFLFIWPEK